MTAYRQKEHRSISGYIFRGETVFDHLKGQYKLADMKNEIKSRTYQFFQDIDDDFIRKALHDIQYALQ